MKNDISGHTVQLGKLHKKLMLQQNILYLYKKKMIKISRIQWPIIMDHF